MSDYDYQDYEFQKATHGLFTTLVALGLYEWWAPDMLWCENV